MNTLLEILYNTLSYITENQAYDFHRLPEEIRQPCKDLMAALEKYLN